MAIEFTSPAAIRLGTFVSKGPGPVEYIRTPEVFKVDPTKLYFDFMLFQEKMLAKKWPGAFWKRLGSTRFSDYALEGYFLSKAESRLAKKCARPSPFWCGSLFSSMSPSYRRVLRLGEQLKLPCVPSMCTGSLFMSSFAPFGGVLYYSGIANQASWYLERPFDPVFGREFSAMLKFNFGFHHDLLHVAFGILIPPPKDMKYRRDYFLFIEALAFLQEFFISEEMGPAWAPALISTNVFYRTFRHDDIRRKVASDRELFLGLLTTYIGSLRGWSATKLGKSLPAWAPFIDDKSVTFHEQFSVKTTVDWMKNYLNTPYPKSYREWPTGPFEKLHLKSFRLEDLIQDEGECDRLWQWMRSLMEYPDGISKPRIRTAKSSD